VRPRAAASIALACAALAGCGDTGTNSDTAARVPTIAHTPPAREPLRCTDSPRARARAHVELFRKGDIVVVPAGIGIRAGVRDGAYVRGRCRAALWTEEPTGLVLMARPATLGALFETWRRPLPRARAWLNGRLWRGPLARLPLRDGAQVVVQEGPPLAPVHAAYTFPP
jgi:hypothetical protein